MTKDEEELLGSLIAAGILMVAGYGVYRLLKGLGALQPGELITANEAVAAVVSTEYRPAVRTEQATNGEY